MCANNTGLIHTVIHCYILSPSYKQSHTPTCTDAVQVSHPPYNQQSLTASGRITIGSPTPAQVRMHALTHTHMKTLKPVHVLECVALEACTSYLGITK